MGIKICLLKTGETVIGDLKEVIDSEKNESLGYKIFSPYIVSFTYRNEMRVVDNSVVQNDEDNSDVMFKFWAPLSSERDFNFPHDFIEVIYEPHRDIANSYITVIQNYQDENTHEVTVDLDQTVVTMLDGDVVQRLKESDAISNTENLISDGEN